MSPVGRTKLKRKGAQNSPKRVQIALRHKQFNFHSRLIPDRHSRREQRSTPSSKQDPFDTSIGSIWLNLHKVAAFQQFESRRKCRAVHSEQ
jgi:hypothetical protein